MSGHIKLYACLCSQSADAADWVPDTCAGHDAPVVAQEPNILTGPMTASHECGERKCLP
jgi:hypothetical protein